MVSFEDAKAFLLQADHNGSSLYDHLSDVLLKLIEARPAAALHNFENISTTVKAAKLAPSDVPSAFNELQDEYFDSNLATAAVKLFKSQFPTPTGEGDEAPVPNEGDIPDVLEEAGNFEWAGVSLGREETFRIALSLKQLVEANPLKSVRFFGKIFGLDHDYYVVESEYKDGFTEPAAADETAAAPAEAKDEDDEDEGKPVKKKEAPSTVPVETGKGANLYTYWVCHTPGEAWTKLPPVTPDQISAARKLTKFLTGHLDAELNTYPAFPGKEINYLRAQIARIGAATVISPKGYYVTEDEDENGEIAPINVNTEFEGLGVADLLNPANWAHHQSHILPQGRAQFVSLKPPKDEDAEEAEDEDKPEEPEEQVETGPKLLTEISADAPIGDKIDAWTVRASSTLSKYSNVTVRSNRWPGAYSYATSVGSGPGSVKFANIYVGFGLKYSTEPYTPPAPPAPQSEPERPTESTDPTVEQEEELEKLKKAQEPEPEAEKEEGEEDEEVEEDE